MELDIFIPSLSIAFEYQGSYHYERHYQIGSVSRTKIRDNEKKQACKKFGITLIEVPFTWKKDTESIQTLLAKHRPDFVS
jgi:hypothetical protein